MDSIPSDHPRYQSLLLRDRIVSGIQKGITSQHGLVAHGRGEAFDYLLSEKTMPSANIAAKAAAAQLFLSKKSVISINGNTAALVPSELISLSNLTKSKMEVNLFHRTDSRIHAIISHLNSFGAKDVLGISPDSNLPGISHDRAKVTSEGLYSSDTVLVPLEDGDRVESFNKMGKTTIVIDLNPLSRSSQSATIPIIDNVHRAIPNIIRHFEIISLLPPENSMHILKKFSRNESLSEAEKKIRLGPL